MQSSKIIPYGKQSISESDVQAVIEVLRSDFLTQGPVVPAFEKAVAEYCHVRHGVATTNATAALHLACLALGLGPGDWLWTSPISFVATANSALYCGAQVDFVDIDSRTYNISKEALEEKLLIAKQEGKLPKILIPVHMCGQPCDMKAIHDLSLQYGFKIIEDASHAIGAKYLDEPVGNCHFSDITVFSFHPVKIITTGEGGMALTNNKEIANKLRYLRSHGITTDRDEMETYSNNEIWNYQQIHLGFNYRMTEMQAALGLSQLKKINEFTRIRTQIAKFYDASFLPININTPWQTEDANSSFHLYPIQLNSLSGISQKALYEKLNASGIKVNLHYIPIYRQPFYKKLGFIEGYCPNAESYFKSSISLPLYASMDEEQQYRVVKEVKKHCLSKSTETLMAKAI
jgi:UDP-4-amino-4,6-dideoxy-N-acetyl-beta-L-altrosamine transaminase